MSRKYREKGIRSLTLTWMLCLAVMLSGCGVSGGDGQITKMDEKYLAGEESAAPKETGEKEASYETGQESDAESDKGQGKENGKSASDSDGEKGTTSSRKTQEPGDKKKNSSEKPADNSEKSSKDEKDSASAKSTDSKNIKSKNTKSNNNKSKNDSREKSSSAEKNTVSEKKDSSQQKDSGDSIQKEEPKKGSDSISCYISIDCKNILAHMSQMKENKRDYVPKDGVILQRTKVTVEPGTSVYDVLYQVCREKKIHMEASYTPMYKSYYVEGIHQLYEFDCGNLSGWNYTVNGVQPSLGCSKYQVKAGDEIAWRFTFERGKDL